jgi:hypothetical protein
MFKAAACNGEPTTWWFPERTGKTSEEMRLIFADTKKAVSICKTCECVGECLQWGGMGEKSRKRARKMLLNGSSMKFVLNEMNGIEIP